MTEAQWMACTGPGQMLRFLDGKMGERKRRLFACAVCRRIWHFLLDERSRNAVEAAEHFADSEIDEATLAAACIAAGHVRTMYVMAAIGASPARHVPSSVSPRSLSASAEAAVCASAATAD